MSPNRRARREHAARAAVELQALASIVTKWVDEVPGVPAVYLFGSRVRGDHRPDSDVDIRVYLRDWVTDSATAIWWLQQNQTDFSDEGATTRSAVAPRQGARPCEWFGLFCVGFQQFGLFSGDWARQGRDGALVASIAASETGRSRARSTSYRIGSPTGPSRRSRGGFIDWHHPKVNARPQRADR